MNKLVLLSLGLTATLAMAEVEMNTVAACVNGGDQLDLKYVNKTPDAWDMRGWKMSIGAPNQIMQGPFAAGAGGSYFVAPGAAGVVNFAGCGAFKGTPFHRQLEAKTGSCNEPTPPQEPAAMRCAEINTSGAGFYNQSQCLKDGLGINRGDGYGGFIDSYRDQTQIQVAIPANAFNAAGRSVRFDPAASMAGGQHYMMGLVALQEYMYVDMQFLLAMGAASSGAGLVDAASGASLYKSPSNAGLDDSSYGSFTVTYKTAVGRLAVDYPKYFKSPLNLDLLVGKGPTPANGPQQLNSAFLATMNLWWLFDGLKAAQNLCFKQFLEEAKDKSAGLKLMLAGYYIGPNAIDGGTGSATDYANHVLPTTNLTVLNATDVTPHMKAFPWDVGGPDHNTRNYSTRVFSVLDQLVAANPQSKACGGALNIYDADITMTQLKELFFGVGGNPGALSNGGLLHHFQIDVAAQNALLTDITCAFNALKGKAPSTTGKDAISYRYDLLTILRVARQHFSGYVNKFTDRPTPADTYSSEYSIWVFNHSNMPCTRSTQDKTWPVLTLADTVYRKGDKVAGTFTDDRGPLKEMAFTVDPQWRKWIATDNNFSVPTTMADTDKLWFRITDSCGNSTIEQVFVRNAPKLPKPVADPKGTTFYDPLPVNLSDSLATATILYTTDGTDPARTAGGSTKLFVKGTPISISSAAPGPVTLKAIAVHPDWAPSDIMIEVYTKVDKPVVATPTANPKGQDFSSLSPGLSVTLSSTTPGAQIFYTIDGSTPATTEGGATKLYTGTPIPVTATMSIKAIATKTDYLNSGVMTETYNRVVPPAVATPAATPPGRNFITPLSVTLATATAGAQIFYTLDGTEPASAAGGSTLLYSGAITLSASATIKAIGIKSDLLPSAIMTERYVFTPPVSVSKAYYKDLNGDGKIETVIVEFEKEIPVVPAKLGFTIVDAAGVSTTRAPANAEIQFAAGSKSKLVVTLASPFPFGTTSVANRDGSGQLFAQENIPLLDNKFAVDDSVPPVVFKATVFEPDSANPEKRIAITVSEPVDLNDASQTAFVFKHEGAEVPPAQLLIKRISLTGDRNYMVYVDTGSQVYPIVGDSVALADNGEVKDKAAKLAPSRKTFKDLDGTVPKPKPTDVYVTFPNGRKDQASDGRVAQGEWVFLPMDQGGNALTGSAADGKCPGTCYTGDNGVYVGPVIHIVTAGPLTWDFSIFNNVGEFLGKGKGKLTAKDLERMERKNDASGIKYIARIVWTGRTPTGGKAGTGAYILQSNLTTEKDTRTGAPPAKTQKRVTFGLLRTFKGS